MTTLLELQYLPPVHYFSLLNHAPSVLIEANENYKKGGYRNRCYIAGANGIQGLSIPLKKGKHTQQPIKDVEISYDVNWQKQHWQSIQSAYGNAPFFEFYMDDMRPFYTKKFDYLWDFNWSLLEMLFEQIPINCELSQSQQFQGGTKNSYYNSISPQNNRPIDSELVFTKKYPQVFQEKHGFLSNLSIIDLLFCTGPEAIRYL